jgi:hypothetical protein
VGAPAPPIVGLIGPLHKKRAMLGAGRKEVKSGRPPGPRNRRKNRAPPCDILRRFLQGRFPQLRKNLRKTLAETGVRP